MYLPLILRENLRFVKRVVYEITHDFDNIDDFNGCLIVIPVVHYNTKEK